MSNDVREVTAPTVETKVSTKRTNLKKRKVIVKNAESLSSQGPNTQPNPDVQPSGLIGVELGDSGVRNLHGIIQEEYNPALNGIQGIKIYDEMRRSDGTVRAALLAITLPIRKAKWRIEPASDDPIDDEIAHFVQKNLFDLMDITWNDLLRQALLMLAFGVMPFEKVFDIAEVEGKTMVILRKLAPRMPKTIYRWELNDGTLGIQQQRQDGVLAEIPWDKMVVFINEQEGDNYWGMSMLRAAYKHWFIKNNFYKIDAIAFERQGLGVPYVKLPTGATDKDKKQAQLILQNLRANEAAYIIEPFEYEMGFKDMMAHTVRDPEPSIQHHNREIAKSVLAQFLELGSGSKSSGGSYALSADQSGLFLQSLQAVAEYVKDKFNKDVIPQLVDLNYTVENYPTLDYTGIDNVEIDKLASAYSTLITAGAVKPIDEDEMFFRDTMNLPELTAEEIVERNEQISEQEAQKSQTEHQNELELKGGFETEAVDTKLPNKNKIKPKQNAAGGGGGQTEREVSGETNLSESYSNFKKKQKFELSEIKLGLESKLAQLPTAQQLSFIDKTLEKIETITTDRKFFDELQAVLTEKQKDLQWYIFQENNDFKGWRKLTFAERKVNLTGIQQMMNKLEESLIAESKAQLNAIKEEYILKVTKLLQDNDLKGIRDLELKYQNDYKDIFKSAMKEAYVFGKNNAAREMGVSAPANPNDLMNVIDMASDSIAESHFVELTSTAKQVITEQLPKGLSPVQLAALVEKALENTIDKIANNTGRIIVAGSVNQGRNTVFEKNSQKIYALQRSEILDSHTCNYCLSVDGRILPKDDKFTKNTIFHSNCRGIWVEILMDEENKPKIGGIPNSLRDRFGDEIDDLSQPKTPIVKKGTLASKFINGE